MLNYAVLTTDALTTDTMDTIKPFFSEAFFFAEILFQLRLNVGLLNKVEFQYQVSDEKRIKESLDK